MSKNSNLPASTVTAYDAETDSMVTVTSEMKERLWQIQRFRDTVLLTECVLLAEVADNKLYLAAGFQSMREFIESTSDYGWRTGYKRIAAGRDAAPLIEAGTLQGVLSDGPVAGPATQNVSEEIRSISKLGIEKLYTMATMEGYSIQDFAAGKEFTAEDGTVITSEDIQLMTSKQLTELSKQFRASEKKYRDAIAARDEAIRKLKAEHQRDESLKAENEKLRKQNAEIQSRVGQQWPDLDESLKEFSVFSKQLRLGNAMILNRPVSPDSPPELRDMVETIRDQINRLYNNFVAQYGPVLIEANEMASFGDVASSMQFESGPEEEDAD